jgi:hypothetical protein
MHIKLATLAATLLLPLGAAYASPPENRPPDNRPPGKGNNGGNNNNNSNNQNQQQQQNQQQSQQQSQTACAEANVVKVGDITISILGSEPIVIEDDDDPCEG